MNEIKVGGIEFKKVCEIEPEIDVNGDIIEYSPQLAYKNHSNLPLHNYGDGSFCSFKIPSRWSAKEGVYVLTVNGLPKYVGECEDLRSRYNMGYSNISPRNCYKGGQQTNCRINKKILEEKKKGSKIVLYFTESDDRFEMEHRLIMKLSPEWNRSVGKPSLGNIHSRTKDKAVQIKPRRMDIRNERSPSSSGKYRPLEEYLSNSEAGRIRLSFTELESILEFSLPSSAHKHRAWWGNGGHTQANAWLNVGWRVVEVNLGESIVFVKT